MEFEVIACYRWEQNSVSCVMKMLNNVVCENFIIHRVIKKDDSVATLLVYVFKQMIHRRFA